MNEDYEDRDPTLILDNIIRYADHNKDFKRDFVDDCYDFREKYGYLSENQLNVLQEIFYNKRIEQFLLERYG